MRLDWNLVREDYFARNLRADGAVPNSLKEVARAWGIAYKTIRNRASAERWNDQLRQRMVQQASAVAQRLQSSELVDEIAVRMRHAMVARYAVDKALQRLETLDPEELSPRDLVELLRLGLTEERKALGIADRLDIAHSEQPSAATLTLGERRDRQRRLEALGNNLLQFMDEQAAVVDDRE